MNYTLLVGIVVFMPFLGGMILSLPFGLAKDSYHSKSIFADVIVAIELIVSLFVYFTLSERAALISGYLEVLDIPYICGQGLHFCLDGFRLLYSLVASFMWFVSIVLSNEYCRGHHNTSRFYVFMLLTLGATQGVFLSSDFFTTFIFFEIMSFTSYVWVVQEETDGAIKAAATYLAIAVIGGLTMLMGIFMIYSELGSVDFISIRAAIRIGHGYTPLRVFIGGICIFVGFAAKAGAFPLHVWLPKAHPVAPAPASALLSGILTKTGIFGMLLIGSYIFYDNEYWNKMIIVLGACTMFGGALLAVFSVDLKRTLACSSMSQIGFIMTGIAGMTIGAHNAYLGYHGALLHMVNHSLIKLVLFSVAGVIYMNCHALELNSIRGYGRKKPLLMFVYLVGALSIAGIPGFSGYISKTLLHESIVMNMHGSFGTFIEVIFLLSGGMTLAYMTKLFICIFVEENQSFELQKKYDSINKFGNPATTFVLILSALVLFIWGLFPRAIMEKVARLADSFIVYVCEIEEVHYFGLECLKGGAISISIGIVLYVFFIRNVLIKEDRYIDLWPKWWDTENVIYRPLLMTFLPTVFGVICRILDSVVDYPVVFIRKTILKDSPLPKYHKDTVWYMSLAGHFMNICKCFVNIKRWIFKEPYNKNDYVRILTFKHNNSRLSYQLIKRSLSFGLLLFGVGFILTMAYLLFG